MKIENPESRFGISIGRVHVRIGRKIRNTFLGSQSILQFAIFNFQFAIRF
jgi:hypothetical protein